MREGFPTDNWEQLCAADFFDHQHRAAIQDEIHARLIPPQRTPVRARRMVFFIGRDLEKMRNVIKLFTNWLVDNGHQRPPAHWRQYNFSTGEYDVTLEAHTEFFTLTWYGAINDLKTYPAHIGLEILKKFPVIAATRIDVVGGENISPAALKDFDDKSLCLSKAGGGKAQIGTDFQPDEHGMTRFEIATNGQSPFKLAVLVRRLFEIDSYRAMALMGLPYARKQSLAISDLELELFELNKKIGQVSDMHDSKNILSRLHGLSVQVGQSLDATEYRFAACRAYGDVLKLRLERIKEQANPNHTTILRYLSNRVDPALATCQAVEKRQLALSDKITRTIQLLDARINVDIQSQNQMVLASISQTARSQYKLQSTVEGLSTIAITYYALGILGYIFAGVGGFVPLSKATMLALVAPFVFCLTWLGVRAVKNRHKSD